MNTAVTFVSLPAALLLAPLLRSVINRIKALFAGKQGPPLLQPYFELAKLLRKGGVYSTTSGWLFRSSPIIGLATILLALLLVPLGGAKALLHFEGDLILFAYLLALGRFFTLLAAMDTGSSFEGMGASREAFFAALAEPTLLLGLGGLGTVTHSVSLSGMYARISLADFAGGLAPALIFITVSLLIIYLTENARIPVDDPTTHLELTMIHEVMILDHGGVDLALIEYAGALKLWVLGLLITGLLLPIRTGQALLDASIAVAMLFLLAAVVGIIESAMARLKLIRIPLLLTIAFVLSALWVIWIAR